MSGIIASGQLNKYTFNLQNNEQICPIEKIRINTDRTNTSRNTVYLDLYDHFKAAQRLSFVREYVDNTLGLGERAKVRLAIPLNCLASGRREDLDVRIAHRISVESMYARQVIDNLFSHGVMTAGNRADVEDILRELERSVQFASHRENSISTAQKDILESVVSPYIELIIAESPDIPTAKRWLHKMAGALKTFRMNYLLQDFPQQFLIPIFDETQKTRSDNFYESIFAVAKFYASMGDLESAFEQAGLSLPSETLIQQTILDFFPSI